MSAPLSRMLALALAVLFFFTAAAASALYTLSLHDALPIWSRSVSSRAIIMVGIECKKRASGGPAAGEERSEEHTSELQSRRDRVNRLLQETKNIACRH